MLIFGLRGTPMISYGTEHWSAGSEEPENRRDMDWNSIDPSHVKHISTLAEFRTQFPVLKEGIPQILHASQDQLIVSQTFGKEQSMLVVNRSTQPMDIPSMNVQRPKDFSFSIETPTGDSPPLLTPFEPSEQTLPTPLLY